MDTDALSVLVVAATAGSLSAAARRLGMAPIAAARRLASLETELGVRLMHRTTRSLSLTPEGEAFLPFAQEMVESAAAGLATVAPGQGGAAGLLRATAPAALGRRVIVPMLPALFAANPQLKLELHLTDRLVDVVGDGFDVAIRIADLRESNLIVRRMGTLRRVLCASPRYLAKRGRPSTIAELAGHDCLTLVGMSHWTFADGNEERRVRISGPLSCSTIDGLHEACLEGLGVSMHASWDVVEDIAAGRLIQLQLDAPPYAPPISALYPSARLVAPKLRVFLKALSEALEATS
jgi:DNA-binding transcriptional LysR family regulator